MEFPQTGQHCAQKVCKQLDFLPFVCQHCSLTFCKEHLQASSHDCAHFEDNFVVEKTTSLGYKCELCETRTPCEMPCVKCKKHFCLGHRHHGCLDPTDEERAKDMEKYLEPKLNFEKAHTVVEEVVSQKLKKAKNMAMANKVQLMRLKGRSVGQNGIPASERRYFLIYYPIEYQKTEKSKGVFVSIQWTVGKIIDYIADLLKVKNTNNNLNSKKLRLFDHSTGIVIAQAMDTKLTDLFNSNSLADGQSLILEYSDDNTIDYTKYT